MNPTTPPQPRHPMTPTPVPHAPTANGTSEADHVENAWMLGQERDLTDPPPPRLKPGEFTLVVRCAKDIEPEEITYLWYPYLPLAKVGLLGGDSGAGKSYLTAALATAHSLGRWPFSLGGKASKESRREPGHTLILSCEDGVADTYIPRLMNLGADRSYIHFIEGKKDWKGQLHRVLLNDKDLLLQAIHDYTAHLVIFDPLQSFLPPHTEMNKMETVRPIVDSLTEAARTSLCHILLLGHLSKAKQETAGYKFLGSVDWYNNARSAMLITKNPESPRTQRFFHQIKTSLGPPAPGKCFSIAEDNEPIFLWGQDTEVTADDVLSGAGGQRSEKEEHAQEFLLGELADGPRPVEALQHAAKALRIAWRTAERAKKTLKIRAHKDGYQGPWVWELPQ
jgi:hypothetical protein